MMDNMDVLVYTAGLTLMGARILCSVLAQTPFSLSVSQDVHRAEQHSNVPLTWIFPVSGVRSTDTLVVDIMFVNDMGRVYNYNSRTKTELYPHRFFRGRVLCDPQLFVKGRIECVFTDLRLNDTGTYQCIVVVGDRHSSYESCDLNVTAAADRRVNETSKPATWEGACLYAGLTLSMLLAVVLTGVYLKHRAPQSPSSHSSSSSSPELGPGDSSCGRALQTLVSPAISSGTSCMIFRRFQAR